MDLNKYFEELEQNLSSVSCNLERIKTLSKILQEILFDNTTFKTQDAQNISQLLLQEITKIKEEITGIENSVQNKSFSLK